MKKATRVKLEVSSETIRVLSIAQLALVPGALQENTGSQQPSGATCPPPKNGEGVGCAGG